MRKIKCLNINKEELTPEKLKELLKDSTYTDEQLKDFVFTIKTLVHIIMHYQKRQKQLKNENEQLKIAA